MIRNLFIAILFAILLITCVSKSVDLKITQIDPEYALATAQQIREEAVVNIADGLELSLWASDTLLADPIAMDIDEQGRAFVTRAVRQKNSEFDIRGHRQWATASISWQTVEDRRAFLREEFDASRAAENDFLPDLNKDSIVDWRDLAVEKDQVIRIEDRSGDGLADFSQVYNEDFHEEITDVTGAVLAHNGEVFIGVAPDLWRLRDTDGDGQADQKTSISHGYGVHVGFGAHGMSGLRVGPDGKIYWAIGDIGANIKAPDGTEWKYPNQGVLVRANPDGSDFEVFAAGLRNTHEFVFDDYGNIISEDNDGDHAGESERLVYIVNGSDAGWRANWQYGKYTDEKNNGYNVWMDEGMYKPRHEGQAAYFIPPIVNFHNGPTGMRYNPGTALGEKWQNKFFIVEFVGNPTRSRIHAFQLKPDGAGFALDNEEVVISGVLPTGMDFGPDGALYFTDWINGWGTKDKGRIWKLDVPDNQKDKRRVETQQLLQSDFQSKTNDHLAKLLRHPDRRVRLKAQFELAKKGDEGADIFIDALRQIEVQIARVHAVWGIAQLTRQDEKYGAVLIPYLEDKDAEIAAQAAKWLGDLRYKKAGNKLILVLQHSSPRVRFFAAEALGRIEHTTAIQPILRMLETNDSEDIYLRHAGVLALARIGNEEALVKLADHPSDALRLAAVLALRRMQSPAVAQFLRDQEEYIIAEASRAINDDWSIEEALPELAKLVRNKNLTNEPALRRAINACSRVGTPETLAALGELILRKSTPPAIRIEAIAALSVWDDPSVLDRVDGRYRGAAKRSASMVKEIASPLLPRLFKDENEDVVEAAINAAGHLQLKSTGKALLEILRTNKSTKVRIAALNMLDEMKDENLAKAIQVVLKGNNPELKVAALARIPNLDAPDARKVDLLSMVFEKPGIEDQQTALQALAALPLEKTRPILERLTKTITTG